MKKMDVVKITLTSEKQARAFVAEGTQVGERLALDLEDAEVIGWFDDPGYCSCEVGFPVALQAPIYQDEAPTYQDEKDAAEKVGATISVARIDMVAS